MVELLVGTVFRTQTKTKDDVFGDCIWKVAEVGLQSPEKGREAETDGVRCVLLGGSGPSARAGYEVIDSVFNINTDIARGVTFVLSPEQAKPLTDHFEQMRAQNDGEVAPRNPALGIEM